MAFVLDTKGSTDVPVEANDDSLIRKLLKDYNESLTQKLPQTKPPVTNDPLKAFYKKMGWTKGKRAKTIGRDNLLRGKVDVQEVMKKSVITPEFEKSHAVPPFQISEKKLREQRRKERELTKGKNWYGLPATEITEEVKHDLEILQMRSVLDPKRFYKKNDLKTLPKYFQVGKVLDSPLDYYNNRLTKKERKKTLVDELLADAAFNKYNKRKFKEIIEEKQKTDYNEWRKAKKIHKKKK